MSRLDKLREADVKRLSYMPENHESWVLLPVLKVTDIGLINAGLVHYCLEPSDQLPLGQACGSTIPPYVRANDLLNFHTADQT